MKKLAILLSIVGLMTVGCDGKSSTPVPKTLLGDQDQDQPQTTKSVDQDSKTNDDQDDDMTPPSKDTLSDADRALVNRIRQVLQSDQALASISATIQIKAHSGNVIISGAVSSPQDRDLIANKIKKIYGVRNLDNQLSTGKAQQRSNSAY